MRSNPVEAEPVLTRTQRARRRDIVEAAIAVLEREGFSAASVDRIAREAGTSKGTVLYHFASKEAIFAAVVGSLFEEGAAYMTERILAQSTPTGRLHAYLDSNLRFIAERAAHITAVHRIQENAGPTGDGASAIAPLRQLLASGQDAGEFGEFDPQVVALTIRAIVDGASYYFTENPGLDIDHHISETIRIFDRAIQLRPGIEADGPPTSIKED